MNEFRKMLMYGVPAVAIVLLAINSAAHAALRDMRVSRIIGLEVVSADGSSLGEVKDLLIDTREGRLAYALLTGGDARNPPADQLVMLPASAMRGSLCDGKLIVGIDRVDSLTTLDRRAWRDNMRRADREQRSELRMASAMLDASLRGPGGRKVGQVEDIVLNLSNGRLRYAVAEFDTSWFADIGKFVVLPITALRTDATQENVLYIAASPTELKDAPAFGRDMWPDPNEVAFLNLVERYVARR